MKKIILIIIIVLSAGLSLQSLFAGAPIREFDIPEKNPHPPETAADKTRVAFAENLISSLLKSYFPEKKLESEPDLLNNANLSLNLSLACVKDKKCVSKNHEAAVYLNQFQKSFGLVIEFKHTHIIPWSFHAFEERRKNSSSSVTPSPPPSEPPTKKILPHNKDEMGFDAEIRAALDMPHPSLKPDEYMIHTYAKMNDKQWYHLNVIVSENEKGEIVWRRLFTTTVPPKGYPHLPEGVVCDLSLHVFNNRCS